LNDTGNTPQSLIGIYPLKIHKIFKEGSPEDCVCMFKYDEVNWNDISCYHKLGGGICKRKCNGGGGGGGQPCGCGKVNCGTDGWSQSANGKGYKIFQLPSPGNYWQVI